MVGMGNWLSLVKSDEVVEAIHMLSYFLLFFITRIYNFLLMQDTPLYTLNRST